MINNKPSSTEIYRRLHSEPVYKTFGLPKPESKSGWPRMKVRFENSADGYLAVDCIEFMGRAKRAGRDPNFEIKRIVDGYEVKIGAAIYLHAELAEQIEARREKKSKKHQPVTFSPAAPVEPEEKPLYVQTSFF